MKRIHLLTERNGSPWCPSGIGDGTIVVSEATCEDCLEEAADYGSDAEDRLNALSAEAATNGGLDAS